MSGRDPEAFVHGFRSAWKALSGEERALAVHACALVCLLLLTAWVFLPVLRWLHAEREAHADARVLFLRVRAFPLQPVGPGSALRDATPTPLIALVNNTAPQFGLGFGDFRPEGDARLTLDLRGGNFDALLDWLSLLETRHSIRVAGIDLRETDIPGSVDGSVVLEQPEKTTAGKQ